MLLELETVFVASVLRYPDTIIDIIDEVRPEAIKNRYLRRIYVEIVGLFIGGMPVSEPAVYDKCKDILQPADFAKLIDIIPSKVNIPHYASEIKKADQKERVKGKLSTAVRDIEAFDIEEILTDLHKLVADETHQDKKNPDIKSAVGRFKKHVDHNSRFGVGYQTGFIFFDDKKHIRYCPNHVWVVGAFTSVGKTSLMAEMLSRGHKQNRDIKTMVFSTEMDINQNITRLITRETKLHSYKVLSGDYDHIQSENVELALKEVSGWNVKMYDDIYEIGEICTAIQKANMVDGVDVVYIDYAQNMSVKGARSEYEATDMIAKSLQRVAKKCGCCVVLFSQLSNSAAKDDEGVLQFKGGGALAAVADLGFIMKRAKDDKSKVMLDMRKNRHGPLGKQVFQYVDNYTRLKEIHDEANE